MRITTQQRIGLGLMWVALALAWNGCASLGKDPIERKVAESEQALQAGAKPTTAGDTRPPNEEKAGPFQKSTRFVHRVQWPGETISIIAKWYTGKLENWKAIVKANPKLKPSRILIGSKIHIPEDLLETREPMPQKFLKEFHSKPKKKRAASRSIPPPEEEKEPVLFGPKEYSPK